MEHQWYYYLSDTFWYAVAVAAVKDYKLLTMFVGGPIIWGLSKFTSWTPWTTDDKVVDLIKEQLGMSK